MRKWHLFVMVMFLFACMSGILLYYCISIPTYLNWVFFSLSISGIIYSPLFFIFLGDNGFKDKLSDNRYRMR